MSLTRRSSLARRIASAGDELLPHVTGEDGRWEPLSPLAAEHAALTGLPWTGGFVAGQLWLAGEHERAAVVTDCSARAPRSRRRTTSASSSGRAPCSACATGDDCHRVLGLRAAASLVERALPSGVIQVIGALDDPEHRGRTIVDTWPNLLLLWWAERQGMAEAGDAAARTSTPPCRRSSAPDGSTFHAARIADDGTVLERGTINGSADDSTWARGPGVGDPRARSAHRATGAYRDEAERAARWFLDHLPDDGPALGLRCAPGRAR